jgi:hypothetical protein
MVSQILNRQELREQSDQVEQADSGVSDTAATLAVSEGVAKRKSAVAKARKPRKPKVPLPMNSPRRIEKPPLRTIASKSVITAQQAEILVADKRAGLTPADMVEQRLQALLLRSSLNSGIQASGNRNRFICSFWQE